MGKTLYLECGTGISGDMTVAALLDLGADREELEKVLRSLPVGGFDFEIRRVKKSGLDACDFSVKLDAAHENHDHDMEYLYGHSADHGHSNVHEHSHPEEDSHTQEHPHPEEHSHVHEHSHPHGHSHDPVHEHRGLREIIEIIEKTEMHPEARKLAVKILTILGEAEGKAHGVPLEEVHFHEVGAVDSIADIVAAAVCFQSLGITEVIIPEICEGKGQVRCQHGIIPVPVPAVVNIVSAHGLPIHFTDIFGELVTPTGAAIAAAVRTGGKLPERFIIEKVGLGAGKREYQRPSILRAMLIRPAEEAEGKNGKNREEREDSLRGQDKIYRLETNIDDSTGEQLGYVMEKLSRAGARDVHYTPVFMKKNRPAYQLNVICDEDKIPELERIVFRETTTIGIRRMELERHILPREVTTVNTAYGDALVKVCVLPDGEKRYYPEYERAAELAEKNGVALARVYEEIKCKFSAGRS